MTTRYHVADPSYQIGTDLLCRDRLLEMGKAPEWKWADAEEGADGDVVCLFQSIADAHEFRQDWLPSGRILSIEINDEMRLTVVGEGYEAVRWSIPAYAISELA